MEKTIVERNVEFIQINILLILSSTIFKIDPILSFIVIMEFIIIRAFREPMHYDKIYKCSFMTIALIGSIFLVLTIDFKIALIVTFIAAIVSSEKTSKQKIKIQKVLKKIFTEGFMYKSSKYDLMVKYRNKDKKKMDEFERRLSKHVPQTYIFYEMRIIKGWKFRKIEEELGCDNRKITDQLNTAFAIFKTYFDIDS